MSQSPKSFIEVQFPVSKVSKESYKERKAGNTQTLTVLGKWWGRKPLVLVRAAIIGLLMPATDNPIKDREVFLKIMTMDEDGLWHRNNKSITQKELYEHLTTRERGIWFDPGSSPEKPKLKRGLSQEQKEQLQHTVFMRFSYDKKLEYCCRPEQIAGPSKEAWQEINEHLGTEASSIPELVRKLGEKQFGHVPTVGDAFCGGGSIPFEAARIGCDAYASDLNPVAAVLTWASLNVLGGGEGGIKSAQLALENVYAAVDQELIKLGVEHNEAGWRADNYLYCAETICPECGWKVPLAPSWVIGEKTRCVARLVPIDSTKRFEIFIESGVSDNEMKVARNSGTIKSSDLVCPNSNCKKHTPISRLRGDRRGDNGIEHGLRMWEKDDIRPRSDDVYQERLYCIRWVETYLDKNGNRKTRKHYLSPTTRDLGHEETVKQLLLEKLEQWQMQGYIPSRTIEPGDKTDEPIRTRGYTYWHHLFNPRQLLLLGLIAETIDRTCDTTLEAVTCSLALNRVVNYNSRLSGWDSTPSKEMVVWIFSNQAFNTLYDYGCRAFSSIDTSWFIKFRNINIFGTADVKSMDARQIQNICDYWITDPPYADAVNYHELSEFYLAWSERWITKYFSEWYTDSKRALAITGQDVSFKKNMIDCYRRLSKNMSPEGKQIVMFTHQNPAVWADLTLILWAAGLAVTSAWCIATETDSAMRTGNYVQGTVLLVLRKQNSELSAFLDEISQEVENEVKYQLDSMLAIDDTENPNFGDTDYQLAAYAAALRVLTKYSHIEEINVDIELSRVRQMAEPSSIEILIAHAVEIACNYLIPKGIEKNTWLAMTPEERFFVKGLEMESHGEYRAGAYQELARGFGMREYKYLLASSRANENRLKTGSEFAARNLRDTGFGNSILRHTLFAVREVVRTEETATGRNWLYNELGNRYWSQRQLITAILDYLSKFQFNQNMEHWHKDAHAAHLFLGAIRNEDHI